MHKPYLHVSYLNHNDKYIAGIVCIEMSTEHIYAFHDVYNEPSGVCVCVCVCVRAES